MSDAQVTMLQGGGDMADLLIQNNFRPECLRPFVGKDGRGYVDTFAGMKQNDDGKLVESWGDPRLVSNAATLTKDAWIHLDTEVTDVFRKRLRVTQDLIDMGLTYNLANAMGTTVLQYEQHSDTNDAETSMDGETQGDNDRPLIDRDSLPIPIIHKDFSFSARDIAVSRNGGAPLDTTSARIAARKVAESVEKYVCGTNGTYTFGGGTIYGLENFTDRLTKTMTAPTASGWTQETTYTEVLAMRQQAYAVNCFGPYMIYASTSWDQYLDAKSIGTTVNQMTLRENLNSINNVLGVKTVDYLSANTMILVQMDRETIELVMGMPVTTVQWDSQGGMRKNFKVMAIMLPRVRSDYNSAAGIVHGSYS